MEFLNSILTGIGAFFAGFVGHITAHDFCAAVPKWSKGLIDFSAKQLAPRDRARYQEEWLADLDERPTVFCQAHARLWLCRMCLEDTPSINCRKNESTSPL